MANNIKRDVHRPISDHARRPELIRETVTRRQYATREAQRWFQSKQRRWAPLAYGVFALALFVILFFTYTTYAFSEYRGVILPGVAVDNTDLSGLTPAQAQSVLINRLAAIYGVPIRLTYHNHVWSPGKMDIGLGYRVSDTVQEAMDVGRRGLLLEQLLDRSPIHPDHQVPLLYHIDEKHLLQYITHVIMPSVHQAPINANLVPRGNDFMLVHAREGNTLDVQGTEAVIHDALGRLSKQTRPIPVVVVRPVITDSVVAAIQSKVEAFLNHPPVLRIGKRVIVTSRATWVPMLHFSQRIGKRQAAVVMQVDSNAVDSYVRTLAAQVDRPAREPKFEFGGGTVETLVREQDGRSLDEVGARTRILRVLTALQPNAHIHVKIRVTKPPLDVTNPASLGISTLLGYGYSSFQGAGERRTAGIITISGRLNDVLVQPGEQISFNNLVGTDWDPIVYQDTEQLNGDVIVPGSGGAMQQVATTFLRAFYAAGLKLLERHAHPYRLSWYEPPVGLDAVVTPSGNDLRFLNNTGKYLLIETRVEPIRQELYIYVYGPKLKWKVVVDALGKITKTYKHGPPIIKQDPSLPAGEIQHAAFAHDGADVVMQRTITYPNGDVSVDQILTHYQPWRAIIVQGTYAPTPTPQPPATATPVKSGKQQESGQTGSNTRKTPPATSTPLPSTTPIPASTPTVQPTNTSEPTAPPGAVPTVP